MARVDVTLTREQWATVVTTVRSAPAGRDVETQYKQNRLLTDLLAGLNVGGDTVALLGWQRKMTDAMLAMGQWRVEGLPKIWAIREVFGWKRPDPEEYDNEEN